MGIAGSLEWAGVGMGWGQYSLDFSLHVRPRLIPVVQVGGVCGATVGRCAWRRRCTVQGSWVESYAPTGGLGRVMRLVQGDN